MLVLSKWYKKTGIGVENMHPRSFLGGMKKHCSAHIQERYMNHIKKFIDKHTPKKANEQKCSDKRT